MSTTGEPAPRPSRAAVAVALAVDAACVVLFVIAGRSSHAEPLGPAEVLGTAWPFLAALGLGWLLARAWRAPRQLWPTAAVIWAVTLVFGMALRGLAGDGLARPFVMISATTLAVLLLGWRATMRYLAGRPATAAQSPPPSSD